MELWANYDFFRDRHIVPEWEKGRPTDYRETADNASSLAKVISEMTRPFSKKHDRVDPRYIDYALGAELGDFGDYAKRISNIGREDDVPKPDWLVMTGLGKNMKSLTDDDVYWVYQKAHDYRFDKSDEFEDVSSLIEDYKEARMSESKEVRETAEGIGQAFRVRSSQLRTMWETINPETGNMYIDDLYEEKMEEREDNK